jgi:hypothetical protein
MFYQGRRELVGICRGVYVQKNQGRRTVEEAKRKFFKNAGRRN